MRIVIVGPMPPRVSSASNPVGGAAVNFAETVRQLRKRGFDLDLVDMSRHRVNIPRWLAWYHNVKTAARIVWRVAVGMKSSTLLFVNITTGRAASLGSGLWVLSAIVGRPMVLRFFGGDFAAVYDGYRRLTRWWADRTYLRAARVLVQTQEIVRRFRGRANVQWFSNTRDIAVPRMEYRPRVRKLLFVAQLRMEKGLGETLEACRALPAGCHLNVYGPPMPNTDFGMFDGHPRATYRGVLRSSEIPDVLMDHDLLLLPSYFEAEGYPGIVLEALQCGRPVIATWWRSIPEVVQHEESALLVKPRSASELQDAILRVVEDRTLYQRLCKGARARGEFFRSASWYDRLAADLRRLAEGD